MVVSSIGTEKVITRFRPTQFPWLSHGQSIKRIAGDTGEVWVEAIAVDVGTEEISEVIVDEVTGDEEIELV